MIDLTQEDIMKNWGVDNSDNPLVSIKCMTYNHENYIAQCIDGFLMQKTNFPFEILIHDDCSTDKTESIVREYEKRFPKIIKGIYETENQWQKGCGAHHTKIDAAIKGKYIALCEGDDYWIDENKLQMQVNVMETNPEVTICYCRVQTFEKNLDKFTIPRDNQIKEGFITLNDFTKEEYYRGNWCFHTSSFFIRSKILIEYINTDAEVFKIFPYGDMPTQLFALCKGKGYFIDKTMSKYRLFSGGYNSSVRANPEKGIVDETKLVIALEKFDEYTEFKYHEDIKHRIKNAYFTITRLSRDRKYAKLHLTKVETIWALYPRLAQFLSKIKCIFIKRKNNETI